MANWLRKWVRQRRRARVSASFGKKIPATTGTLKVAACHPVGGLKSPLFRTSFQQGLAYRGMDDVEIRGFLDGTYKFKRNVANQYHLRIGCESSKPDHSRYEVMRVLARWDVSALPASASVSEARMVFHQEDITLFPHHHPLRWPVDFYLYEVRKEWNPGRGGVEQDSRSPPEPGDAWWLEAKAGELPWREAGCGYGSDDDPNADRAAHPLAHARLLSPGESLVFCGQRLSKHIEHLITSGKPVDVLIKASAEAEATPGTIKSFFSREFGDDFNPERRPTLEIAWSSRALWVEEWPFVLEPGGICLFRPQEASLKSDSIILSASVRLDEIPKANGGIVPEVQAVGWKAEGGEKASHPLEIPLRGLPGEDFHVRLSTARNPVPAGERLSISILETWTPAVKSPEDLPIFFRFMSPSGKSHALKARYGGHYQYVVDFLPDEIGVWSYAWKTCPDRRFREQKGEGSFTVVRGHSEAHLKVLGFFTDQAIQAAWSHQHLLSRRQAHFRLTALQKEIHSFLKEAEAKGAPEASLEELREFLTRITQALPLTD